MKFYGNGTVWDKDNNRALCRFVNGEFETDNERTATLLHTLGYRSESDGWKTYEGESEGGPSERWPVEEKPAAEEKTKAEIIDELKQKKIKHDPRKRKDELASLLGE